jgi:hypothetical protein
VICEPPNLPPGVPLLRSGCISWPRVHSSRLFRFISKSNTQHRGDRDPPLTHEEPPAPPPRPRAVRIHSGRVQVLGATRLIDPALLWSLAAPADEFSTCSFSVVAPTAQRYNLLVKWRPEPRGVAGLQGDGSRVKADFGGSLLARKKKFGAQQNALPVR